MRTVGSEGLDPTAGGGIMCTADNMGGNIKVYGFWCGFFKCFSSNHHVVAYGSVPKAGFDLCKVLYRPKGFGEGFYQCRDGLGVI